MSSASSGLKNRGRAGKNRGRAGQGQVNISDSFVRAMRMLRMLGQSQGLSAGEIVARLKDEGFSSTEKRVRETLRKIQDAGVGVWEDQEDRTESGASRWKLHVGIRVGDVLQLNRHELLALYLSRQSLTPLKEATIYRDFESAFKKIDQVLGRPEMRGMKSLEAEVHFMQFHGSMIVMNRDVVDTVHSACAEGHVLEVEYFSPQRQVVELRKFGPHFMTYAGGALYLFAEDLATQQLKTFSLARMKSAVMLPEEYNASRVTYQEAFGQDLSIVRGADAPQKVVLRFQAGGAATYVRERSWHPSQQVQSLADGSIRLEMTVSMSSWLVKWILGFEESVEILEPASLRKKVISAAEAIIKIYRKNTAA